DLAARLGAQAIRVPSLRDRIEDVGALVHYFLMAAGARRAPELEAAAFHALCHYAWPRNVRELQKVITEAVAISEGASCLRLAHLPESVAAVMEPSPRPVLGASPASKRPSPTR